MFIVVSFNALINDCVDIVVVELKLNNLYYLLNMFKNIE